MRRMHADLLLLLAALIWGTAFVAQKTANEKIGPMTFVACRASLTALVLLPFALAEHRRSPERLKPGDLGLALLIGLFLFIALGLQQQGLVTATVTNAGFLTSLYIVMVPFIAWALWRKAPHTVVWPAAVISVVGVFLLGGGTIAALTTGDWLIIACALASAFHIVLIAVLLQRASRPMGLTFVQFLVVALLGLIATHELETVTRAGLIAALPEIIYAGIISGGIAYSLQAIAQRYTPPSDAAIIMGSEALFAALAGALLLGERLTAAGWLGAALILVAVLLVELVPLTRVGRGASRNA